MKSDKKKNDIEKEHQPEITIEQSNHGRIFTAPEEDKYLDSFQLNRLEEAFRSWAGDSKRSDVRESRMRILLIFLIIRYAGAKLNEVLSIDPVKDIDFDEKSILLGGNSLEALRTPRKVRLSEKLCTEIRSIINESSMMNGKKQFFNADPGFVRRKFYERAEACGFGKQLGAPEVLRKSRGVELMQGNMPLPAVQMLLGHSTPNLTTSYVSFSEDDIQEVTRMFMEKESSRKTSARNSFFGKIQSIQKGDIQAIIELATIGGHRVMTIITTDSLERLGLREGKMITAEVKAPWVMLQKANSDISCSADNILKGTVEKIKQGRINSEYITRLSDGTEVCAIITSDSAKRLALHEGDIVWAMFNCYSVVLLAD